MARCLPRLAGATLGLRSLGLQFHRQNYGKKSPNRGKILIGNRIGKTGKGRLLGLDLREQLHQLHGHRHLFVRILIGSVQVLVP